jgi:hypothetical protein
LRQPLVSVALLALSVGVVYVINQRSKRTFLVLSHTQVGIQRGKRLKAVSFADLTKVETDSYTVILISPQRELDIELGGRFISEDKWAPTLLAQIDRSGAEIDNIARGYLERANGTENLWLTQEPPQKHRRTTSKTPETDYKRTN